MFRRHVHESGSVDDRYDEGDRYASGDRYQDGPSSERRTHIRPWSPAQIVAIAVGIAAVVMGIAGLAKTGLPLDHLDHPYHNVLGFRHAPLLGIAEIGFGVLLIISGVVTGGARWLMALLGVVQTVFGVIVLVDVAPHRIHRWLGVGDPYGWLSVIVGAFLLLTALFLPDITPARRESRRHHVVT